MAELAATQQQALRCSYALSANCAWRFSSSSSLRRSFLISSFQQRRQRHSLKHHSYGHISIIATGLMQTVAASNDQELQDAKFSLLKAVRETERGLLSPPEQRSVVEESMVAVEAYDAGFPLDLKKLDGTWLLQYTTAADVLSILQAGQTPFLKVGQIFQKFECQNTPDGGLVRNIVRWSVPGIFEDLDGATLTVTAKFYVASARNIALQFEEAALGSLMVSEELQALLAPAFLPRTFFSLEVLQFIRGFTARVPLRTVTDVPKNVQRAPLGLLYYISFLDNDMLLGRALGGGGIFIFSRTQPLQTP